MENPSLALETLAKLAEASKAQRLAPADEDHATTLIKELLAGGRAGITSAIEPLVALPWIVGANAVSAAWPTLTVPMRRHLLTSLAKTDSEPARRLRLSLARAVFKLEPAAGLKIAAATAADLREPETGALPPKHRHMFFNVFIGKGKPWLLQLPLADLKGAEADCLVHAAVECFQLCPPLSQLSILRWAFAGGRLKKLSPEDLEVAVKSVSRWNPKLQRQLRTDIPELPEPIAAVLKPEALKPTPEMPARQAEKSVAADGEGAEPVQPAEAQAVADESGEPTVTEAPKGPKTQTKAREPERAAPAKPIEEITIPRRNRPQPEGEPEQRQPREQREPRRTEQRSRDERPEERRDDKGRRPFDFRESLRGLEAYVSGLRNELDQTKTQLRRREEDTKRGGRPGRGQAAAEERPAVETEALIRHNAQLETTVRELRAQLEDLASHHEAVAESRQLHSGEPLPEGSADQLKALLSIKLQESFETYMVMRQEPLDKVFRLDYRDLLGSVFDVLLEQGVQLKKQ